MSLISTIDTKELGYEGRQFIKIIEKNDLQED
jgi:hypothetical protein